MPLLDPSRFDSLVTLLVARAERHPDDPLFTFVGDDDSKVTTWSFAEVVHRASATAAWLAERHAVGDRLLIANARPSRFIEGFLGALFAGLIPVPAAPLHPTRGAHRLATILTRAAPVARLSDANAQGPRGLLLPPRVTLPDASTRAWRTRTPRAGDVAFIQFTSGSTAAPRGVCITHRNLTHNGEMIRRAFGHRERASLVSWLPLHHDMGLIGNALQAIHAGMHAVLMTPEAALRRPVRWLEAISRWRAHTSGAPNFAFDLCVRRVPEAARAALDLHCWRVAFNGAEPVRRRTLEAFTRAFAPSGFRAAAFCPCYGLAEATLVVSSVPHDQPTRALEADADVLEREHRVEPARSGGRVRELVLLGAPLDDSDALCIVDPETRRRCEEGSIGEVWLRGESRARGYWGAETFDAQLIGADLPPGGWLRTGDLGVLWKSQLAIVGRLKALIIQRGRNLHPEELEETLERASPALRPGGAFVIQRQDGSQIVALIERTHAPLEDREALIATLQAALEHEHGVNLDVIAMCAPRALPRTTSGKKARVAALDALDRGALIPEQRFDAMRDPAPDDLRVWIARHLKRPPGSLAMDRTLLEQGADSLSLLELSHALETAMGVLLSPAQLAGVPLGQLAGLGREADRPPTPSPYEGPLSASARGAWLAEQLQPGDPRLMITRALDIRGPLREERLREALEATLAEHPALRLSVETREGAPRWRAAPDDAVELAWSRSDAPGDIEAWINAESARRFALDASPLLRVSVRAHEDTRWTLLMVAHHVLLDLWSMTRLVEALLVRLEGRPHALETRDPGPAAHARWETRWSGGAEAELAREAWRRITQSPFASPPLPPADAPNATPRAPRVFTLASAAGSSALATLVTAFAAVMWRYGARQDTLVATLVAGRARAWQQALCANLTRLAPLRLPLAAQTPTSSLEKLLEDTQRALIDSATAGMLPQDDGLRAARWGGDGALPSPLRVLIARQSTPSALPGDLAMALALGEPSAPQRVGETLEVAARAAPEQAPQFDLAVLVATTSGRLVVRIEHDGQRLDADVVARLSRHLEAALSALVEAPTTRLRALAIPDDDERVELLSALGCGDRASIVCQTPVEQILEVAKRAPSAPAVIAPDVSLTRGELISRAEVIARRLETHSIGEGSGVVLALEQGAELIIAMIAVALRGALFAVIDPADPEPRRRRAIEALRPAAVIEAGGRLTLCAGPHPVSSGCVAAYFTSGSTGHPRAALVPWRGVINRFAWMTRVFPEASVASILTTPPIHDSALWQLWWPLTRGGRVVISPRRRAPDVRGLVEAIAAHGVTILDQVPAALRLLVEALERTPAMASMLRTLRALIVGGDAMDGRVARRFMRCCPWVRVFNLYGPTEASIGCIAHELMGAEGAAPPIGRPIDNVSALILTPEGALAPRGIPGALFLGGVCIGPGYLGDAASTASSWRLHDFEGIDSDRIYRTGDRARWDSEGRLRFLGREDDQLKVRGVRLSPVEVEQVIAHHPEVIAAAVAVVGDTLAAWFVPRDLSAPPTPATLRAHTQRHLPMTMVPSRWTPTDALPRTDVGTLDRAGLCIAPREMTSQRPRGAMEERIAGIWREVLGVEEVDAARNFFDLGGHSLALASVHGRLCHALEREVPLMLLFEHPTIEALSRALQAPLKQSEDATIATSRGAARRRRLVGRRGRTRSSEDES